MSFPFVIALLAIGTLIVFGWWYNSPKQKGKRGEERVYKILLELSDEYHIFNDVILDTGKRTTQIDHIVVSKYGVFAIETKNYRGEIYGNDDQDYWKQIIVTKVTYRRNPFKTYTYVTKNQLYNPVKQSLAHVYVIKQKLTDWSWLPVVPIVVFCGNAYLKKVDSKYHVVYDNELIDTIQSYKTIYLSDSDIQEVINKLALLNLREVIDDDSHVLNVIAKEREKEEKLSKGICPRCGGDLVLRKGKYGNFYGCSNYPSCKYTIR